MEENSGYVGGGCSPGQARGRKELRKDVLRFSALASILALLASPAALAQQSGEDPFERGRGQYEQGQLDEAIDSFREAIAARPEHADAHAFLGRALHDKDDVDRAIASYRKAIELHPQPEFVSPGIGFLQFNLAMSLAEGRSVEGALEAYLEAIEGKSGSAQPALAATHHNLGRALLCKGPRAEAIASFLTALQLQPELAEAYNNLGVALRDLKQFDGAMALFRKAVEIRPDFAEARGNLETASSQREAQQQGEARPERALTDSAPVIAQLREAVERQPDDPVAHERIAAALRSAGREEEAQTHLNEARRLAANILPPPPAPAGENDPVITTSTRLGPNVVPATMVFMEPSLTGLAVDHKGNLFLSAGSRVFKVDPSGNLTVVAELATEIPQARVSDVAVDPAGNLFIADEPGHRVLKVDPSGIITTVAGNGTRQQNGDDGPATEAGLAHPMSIAVDGQGNLFIADGFGHVRGVDPSGIIDIVAGRGNQVPGDGGPATGARLSSVRDMAVDGSGNLFIVDVRQRRIRKVDRAGIITTVANRLTIALAADSAGNLFLAFDGRALKLDPTGTVTTVAGGGTASPDDGGPATGAKLSVHRLAVDRSGNLFMADNQRVFKVDPLGVLTIVAGKARTGY